MHPLRCLNGSRPTHLAEQQHIHAAAWWRTQPLARRRPACRDAPEHTGIKPTAFVTPTSMNTRRRSTFSAYSSSSSSSSAEGTSRPRNPLTPSLLAQQALVMASAGATLGPLCDGLHSQHNVLHYAHPTLMVQLGSMWSLETCWWVPLLFGLAGLILGVSYPVLDTWAAQGGDTRQGVMSPAPAAPSWLFVHVAIAFFVLQYWLSAVLEVPLLGATAGPVPIPLLDVLLAMLALAHWRAFDATQQGFAMSALTAVAGPVVEIVLINSLGLYHYSHAAIAGIPTWIPWVYFCGGPAVGGLGRRVWYELSTRVTET